MARRLAALDAAPAKEPLELLVATPQMRRWLTAGLRTNSASKNLLARAA
ncbi:hypothetical protein [Mycolicibacterium sp.]